MAGMSVGWSDLGFVGGREIVREGRPGQGNRASTSSGAGIPSAECEGTYMPREARRVEPGSVSETGPFRTQRNGPISGTVVKPCVKCGAEDRYEGGGCRACAQARAREWKKRNPEKVREGNRRWRTVVRPEYHREYNRERYAADSRPFKNRVLKMKYGITLAQYESMAAAQCGVCAICGNAEEDGRALAVDHDHATGEIRGLLCGGCNLGLGNMGDSPDRLRAAIEYLGG